MFFILFFKENIWQDKPKSECSALRTSQSTLASGRELESSKGQHFSDQAANCFTLSIKTGTTSW